MKNTRTIYFKSARIAILLSFFFGCIHPIFSKSNGREVLAWRLSPESDIYGYRVYCGEASSDYSRMFDAGLANLFDISVLQSGKRYYCAVTALDESGNESAFSDEISFTVGPEPAGSAAPGITSVFPNPSRGISAIWAFLSDSCNTRLCISDVLGRRVRTVHSGPLAAGAHAFIWDGLDDAGSPVRSGLYIATLTGAARSRSGKLTLIR